MELKVDSEFRGIIPPLTTEEYQQLEKSIVAEGCRDSLVVWDNIIIDGHNRYEICRRHGIQFRMTEKEFESRDHAKEWIIKNQFGRRNLSAYDRSLLALKLKEMISSRAKEKQKTHTKQGYQKSDKAEHTAKELAKIAGVSHDTIYKVEKIEQKATPEQKEKIKKGQTTINAVYKQIVIHEDKEEQKARSEEVEKVSTIKEYFPAEVTPGQFWSLGNHILYCGDTSKEEFISRVPTAAFAFADPPYNAGAAEWDKDFVWQHDWLMEKAGVVAVTPGIVSIFDFAKKTKMPYAWSVACWINNGMTRGAMGFGNWIYVALFSNGSIYCNSQDFLQVSISNPETMETSHRGRKPAGLLVWLIDKFSKPGDIIIDPFLGSGTTLLAAESTGRFCFGGELNPLYCAEIMVRWEKQTGKKAVLINGKNSLST